MIKKGMKELIKNICISGISIKFGFISLSISGGSSKANMLY
ncbi:hypothetical protein [Hathewaya proteolytica]|nr:hypothetical protein [Hathewaya proteolytica]